VQEASTRFGALGTPSVHTWVQGSGVAWPVHPNLQCGVGSNWVCKVRKPDCGQSKKKTAAATISLPQFTFKPFILDIKTFSGPETMFFNDSFHTLESVIIC